MIAIEQSSKAQAEIERVLESDTLRSCEGLRRLLKFLAEKSFSGEADALKEYSIGVDAFGKPSTYDPRQDSTVRAHVGRLRQKLSEYYQSEGKEDPMVVELPKGRFKLQWRERSEPPLSFESGPVNLHTAPAPANRRTRIMIVYPCLLASIIWGSWSSVQLREARKQSGVVDSQWTPDVAAIWKPFVQTERPVLISISAPVFFSLPGFGIFYNSDLNRASDIPKSAIVSTIQKALHTPPPQPIIYFTTLGDADVSFRLGKLLGARKANVSVVNGTELSWKQMSDNNVILIGSPKFFNQQLTSMPVKTELLLEPHFGIRNLSPREHEPAAFIDSTQSRMTGITYALVSHTPGPQGTGEVLSISCRNGAGILGAATFFTDPALARDLVGKLRKRNGEFPRFYQVVLKIRFQDGVPLETSYVLHRELAPVDAR